MAEKERLFKVCMFGPAKGGKTSLLQRLKPNCFDPECRATIGVDFLVDSFDLGNIRMNLQLWDIAGQDPPRTILNRYFGGSAAVVLVYDVSDEKSLNGVKAEYDRCLEFVNKEEVFMVLVGNKSDLKSTPDYTEAGRTFAKEKEILFIATSADRGTNVRKLFRTVAVRLCNRYCNSEGPCVDMLSSEDEAEHTVAGLDSSEQKSMVAGSSKSICWGFCCCDDDLKKRSPAD